MSYVAADRHRSCVGRAAPHWSGSGANFQNEGCSDRQQVAASKKNRSSFSSGQKHFFLGTQKIVRGGLKLWLRWNLLKFREGHMGFQNPILSQSSLLLMIQNDCKGCVIYFRSLFPASWLPPIKSWTLGTCGKTLP